MSSEILCSDVIFHVYSQANKNLMKRESGLVRSPNIKSIKSEENTYRDNRKETKRQLRHSQSLTSAHNINTKDTDDASANSASKPISSNIKFLLVATVAFVETHKGSSNAEDNSNMGGLIPRTS